jgi:hypothetical protein
MVRDGMECWHMRASPLVMVTKVTYCNGGCIPWCGGRVLNSFVRVVRVLSLLYYTIIRNQLDVDNSMLTRLLCTVRAWTSTSMTKARHLSQQSLDPASPHTFEARSIKRQPG